MFDCPVCGGRTRVVSCRPHNNEFIRYRKCKHCGYMFYTKEISTKTWEEGWEKMKDYWREVNKKRGSET